ncbi:hypothetical protein SNOG_05976 [Parastagonospora nodorum SN15]|uniref:Uncharacterized protein n=1 Tax=Phaeosphaeria nodorum (strain SN15 / ATCC MYA-4574 / FGSC 10173) TaxID=321614 RepID=Q0UQI8_PHANO|nr:hypothetical protein SNOG_05976 [Parastagonospora nodorum SN15]EAT87040.1 hypothetical protein SNOG_05976 [Parastagonospora nodorum SN15]
MHGDFNAAQLPEVRVSAVPDGKPSGELVTQ